MADTRPRRPDEIIDRGPVRVPRKLGFTQVGRRPLDLPPLAGTGIGVVWQLAR
jgi:hypothetical protein